MRSEKRPDFDESLQWVLQDWMKKRFDAEMFGVPLSEKLGLPRGKPRRFWRVRRAWREFRHRVRLAWRVLREGRSWE